MFLAQTEFIRFNNRDNNFQILRSWDKLYDSKHILKMPIKKNDVDLK